MIRPRRVWPTPVASSLLAPGRRSIPYSLLHREGTEDVRHAGRNADRRIAVGHAEQRGGVNAHGTARVTGARAEQGSAVAPGQSDGPGVGPAVDLPDHFEPGRERAGEGEPIGEHV